MTTMTTEAAAERLGLTPQRVRLLAKQGRIKGKKIGRDWHFIKAEVERFAAIPRRAGQPKKIKNIS